jgi:predicted ATPase/class 3 adenylate cyclase
MVTMGGLPAGTVTFLFTDIEGSTRLLQRLGRGYVGVLEDHRRLLRRAFADHGGVEVKSEGDGFFVAFARAADGVAACLAAQLAVASHAWPEGAEVRVRMGLHTGEAVPSEGDYTALAVHQAARITAAGHGGQVLLSEVTRQLVAGELPDDTGLCELGEHRLKDFETPQRLFQLCQPGLPDQFPPLRTDLVPTNNLPVPRTSFVGRGEELAEVGKLLESTRLMTVTGPAGVGKTRMALELATAVLDEYRHGAWFVELAAVADPGLVPHALAASLQIREQPGREPLETIVSALRPRQLLVVLDNCEHVVDACAQVVETLLVACDGLKVLATSREPLGVAGECIWRIPPLPAPERTGELPVEVLAQYDAVRLFVDRARSQSPAFALTPDNAPAVAQICRRLDGIPLAIELAAARTRLLGTNQIAQRLDDRFRLLTGGARTAVRRQQTLRAAVEWSYELLGESERTLWRRLSVFPAGFALESAEEVCGGEGLEPEEVLDQLAQLTDKSIVGVHDQGGEARYSMLETLRQYGSERLAEAGEAHVTRRRHAAHFLELAERLEAPAGRSATNWLRRLEVEHDNLRAALDWSLATGETEIVSRLARAVAPMLLQIGRASEVEPLARAALAGRPEPPIEVALRRSLGEALWVRGHMAAAIAELEAAAEVIGAPDAERVPPLALAANIRLFLGDVDRAREQAERARVEGERVGDDLTLCLALQTLAIAADARGLVDEAVGLARRAVVAASRTHHPLAGYLYPHLYLGLVLLDSDRFDEAVAALEEGRCLSEARGSVLWLPLYHWALGIVRIFRGELDEGSFEMRSGLDLANTVGTRLHAGFLHGAFAFVAFRRDELAEAEAWLSEASREVLAAAADTWRTEAEKDVVAAGPMWPVEWGLWLNGLLLEARGDRDQAASTLDWAWQMSAPLRGFLGYRLFAPDLVRLALQVGNRERAVTVTEEVEELARRAAAPSAEGVALRCRGLVEGDATLLLRSVEAYRRGPRLADLAYACEDAAAALVRAGRVPEAAALLEEALGIHERAGAKRDAARVGTARAALG